jgi:hypothetical protein
MKAAVISLCLIATPHSAVAQSLFDGFGGPEQPVQCGTTPEEKQWRAIVIRQLRERVPRLDLGSGSVSIRFDVDYAGRVARVAFPKYDNNAQALVAAGMITALKLPPPPDSVERRCRTFLQTFNFHGSPAPRCAPSAEGRSDSARTTPCR